MVTPGKKAYDVKCLSCGWEEMFIVGSQLPGFLSIVDKLQLPFRCPECGKKVERKENKLVVF
jgi:predicted RNA-binding Zn-ribbon protein involved in translation (DUF1610 family)